MYSLVYRIPHGLDNLKTLLEEHIHSQGLKAIDKCGESAIGVSIVCILGLASNFEGVKCFG